MDLHDVSIFINTLTGRQGFNVGDSEEITYINISLIGIILS
jgi:hypothetical protein